MRPINLAFAVVVSSLAVPAQRFLASHCDPVGGDRLGASVAAAGDVDGDGHGDWIVGADGYNGTELGNARVFSGLDGRELHRIQTTTLNSRFGRSVAGVGDLDNDGRADFAVGATRDGSGVVTLYSGATGATFARIPDPNGSANSDFGVAMAALGDVDGDAVPDFVACAVNAAHLISGATRLSLRRFVAGTGNFCTVAALGDVNGDGKQDFAITGLWSGGNASVAIYSPLSTTPLRTIVRSTAQWPLFGASLGGGGDLNGDGVPDLLIGDTSRMGANQVRGVVVAISGANGAELFQIHTLAGNQHGAGSCTIVDDLNADGRPDIVVGDGIIQFHSGSDGRALSNFDTFAGGAAESIAVLPDRDGDGLRDFVIGYPSTSSGCAHVVSSRILARVWPLGSSCGHGTLLPQLHATRTVLGATATITGLHTPSGAVGTLFLGPLLARSFPLALPECRVWIDLGLATVVALPSTPTWQMPLPVPAIPALAGFEIGMQAVWAPTTAVLGFDLTNAVGMRLGD